MNDFLKKLFEPTIQKRMFFFVILDLLFIELAAYLAFLLRFDGQIPQYFRDNLLSFLVLAPIFIIPVLYFQKIYWLNWSYVSLRDIIRLIRGITFSFLIIGILIFISRDAPYSIKFIYGFPRSTIFISYVITILFLGSLRLSKRIYLQLFRNTTPRSGKKTLIVGAGDAGEQILRNILSSNQKTYLPIGFIDDDPFKQNTSIHGYKVIGKIENIPHIVKTQEIEQAIIAMPSSESGVIRKAVELCRSTGMKEIKILPSLSELLSEKVTLRDLREIQIEDLLGRDPVKLDTESLNNFINKRKVLITGAAGSVGSELARQIAKFKPEILILLDQEETALFYLGEEFKRSVSDLNFKAVIADIRNQKKIERIFDNFQPEIVFHAAAYKHVPVMEEHPDEAVKNNIFGTLVVGKAAIKNKVKKFVFISTDKAVAPISIMGKTKRLAEVLIQLLNNQTDTDFVAVRFGNVLASRGSVVPIFKEQIKKGGPVTVTHPDMERFFMIPAEAALLVVQAGAIGSGGKVYFLDMGKPVKILELAKEMIRLSGYEPDVDIPIIFAGTRPGEKITEELFMQSKEEFKPTEFSKIFEVSDNVHLDPERFLDNLNELFKLSEEGSPNLIIQKLDKMIKGA